jgi:hypothetical protein
MKLVQADERHSGSEKGSRIPGTAPTSPIANSVAHEIKGARELAH